MKSTTGDLKAELARLATKWVIHETSDGEYSVTIHGKKHSNETDKHDNLDDALSDAIYRMSSHLSACPLCRS